LRKPLGKKGIGKKAFFTTKEEEESLLPSREVGVCPAIGEGEKYLLYQGGDRKGFFPVPRKTSEGG